MGPYLLPAINALGIDRCAGTKRAKQSSIDSRILVTNIMVTKATTFGGAFLSMKGLYLTLALIIGLTNANAITIRFDDADRPPSDTLNVGGVTVTGGTWGGPGRPATTLGFGLGSDSLGSSFAIERVEHYPSGSLFRDDLSSESLRLTVDGVINSITIMPRISVFETGKSLDLSFEILPAWDSPDRIYTTVECNGTSTTILNRTPASGVDLIIASDFGEYLHFLEYRESRGLPDETLVFGFSILSLDYTPVPDTANSAWLLGIGIFGIVCAGRSRGWFARS